MHTFVGAAVATAALLAVSGVAIAEPAPAFAGYPALFDEMWRDVDQNFYDPTFNGHDWKAIGARYRAELSTVKTDRDFSRLAYAMLDELHVSHLFLTQPERDRAVGGAGLGARIETIGKDHVVIDVPPMTDAQRKGLRVGDRILTPDAAVRGPLGSVADVRVRGCDGRDRSLRIRREGALWPPTHPGFWWRRIDVRPGVSYGYIRIDRFDDGAAELADEAMAEFKDTQAIVIDIRENSGGDISSLRLVSYFEDGSQPVVALLARPYLQALGRPVTKSDIDKLPVTRGAYTDAAVFRAVREGRGSAVFATEDIGAKRYRGKVAVVMGNETGSAGEGFAAVMKTLAHATEVGRPTAGYLLSSDRIDLPGGWTLTYPAQGVWAPDGTDFKDTPVQPDVLVPRTAADVCRADDPDLTKAIEVLEAR
ncbi:MAG TPA: S41 family peptidase [Caulobacteraceae bacterium]|jgi:carboxyl-terminal processing protease|nr:S41 family peptidase [Caulobacteraceae bacterium]